MRSARRSARFVLDDEQLAHGSHRPSERERHRGAAARRVVDSQVAAERFGEAACDREPETRRPGRDGVAEPLERLEHLLPVGRRDAGAAVDDAEHHRSRDTAALDPHRLLGRRPPQRVVDDVRDRALEQRRDRRSTRGKRVRERRPRRRRARSPRLTRARPDDLVERRPRSWRVGSHPPAAGSSRAGCSRARSSRSTSSSIVTWNCCDRLVVEMEVVGQQASSPRP